MITIPATAVHSAETVENLRHTRDLWFNEAARLRTQLDAVRAAHAPPSVKQEEASRD